MDFLAGRVRRIGLFPFLFFFFFFPLPSNKKGTVFPFPPLRRFKFPLVRDKNVYTSCLFFFSLLEYCTGAIFFSSFLFPFSIRAPLYLFFPPSAIQRQHSSSTPFLLSREKVKKKLTVLFFSPSPSNFGALPSFLKTTARESSFYFFLFPLFFFLSPLTNGVDRTPLPSPFPFFPRALNSSSLPP